jgi:arsenate reductase (glutaredoxin)
MKVRIYHNPRCSKSRATLALLEERDVDLDVVEYLRDPPTKQALRTLLRKLRLGARDIVRTNEPEFKAAGVPIDAPDDELLDLLVNEPKLIQRPIVEVGARARIGRPPEQVLELLD